MAYQLVGLNLVVLSGSAVLVAALLVGFIFLTRSPYAAAVRRPPPRSTSSAAARSWARFDGLIAARGAQIKAPSDVGLDAAGGRQPMLDRA